MPPEGQQNGLPALPPWPHAFPHAPQFTTDACELTLVHALTDVPAVPQHLYAVPSAEQLELVVQAVTPQLPK